MMIERDHHNHYYIVIQEHNCKFTTLLTLNTIMYKTFWMYILHKKIYFYYVDLTNLVQYLHVVWKVRTRGLFYNGLLCTANMFFFISIIIILRTKINPCIITTKINITVTNIKDFSVIVALRFRHTPANIRPQLVDWSLVVRNWLVVIITLIEVIS